MKKLLTLATILVVSLFISCATTTTTTETVVIMQDEIKSENLVINTCFDKDDYVILGSVKGESDFVYYDTASQKIVGDSMCYGTLNQSAKYAIGKGFAAGYGKALTVNGNTPLDIAKSNAYYKLIENAYALGADTVLEPTVQIETNTSKVTSTGLRPSKIQTTTSYKVTVRAIAVQLKKGN